MVLLQVHIDVLDRNYTKLIPLSFQAGKVGSAETIAYFRRAIDAASIIDG
jgi:hypothetical protein